MLEYVSIRAAWKPYFERNLTERSNGLVLGGAYLSVAGVIWN